MPSANSYSFHVPCIILSNVYFYNIRSMFFLHFNRSQSKASVVNQMNNSFFEAQKYFLDWYQLVENDYIHNIVLTLINVVKLEAENNNIISTPSNFVNINVWIWSCDVRKSQINFESTVNGQCQQWNLQLSNHYCKFQRWHTRNVVSSLIWLFPMLQLHITLKKIVQTTLKYLLGIEEYC